MVTLLIRAPLKIKDLQPLNESISEMHISHETKLTTSEHKWLIQRVAESHLTFFLVEYQSQAARLIPVSLFPPQFGCIPGWQGEACIRGGHGVT